MVLRGVFVNVAGVALGGFLGTIFGKKIPTKMGEGLMAGLGLCVMFTGIGGVSDKSNILIAVISISIGAILGELIDIHQKIENLGEKVQGLFSAKQEVSIAEGFVSTSLFVCMGAMSIVGSIDSGMLGNPETFYTKALIDTVLVAVLATTMGIGCSLASISVLIFQGGLTILSSLVAGMLTAVTIEQMAYVGSILIFAVGLNMLKITNIRVANLVFAPFIPILFQKFL